jgi:hypothetical protein
MDQKILEALADISYFAGQREYYTGDSRADILDFIWWAKEFEHIHRNTNWDSEDYMLAIELFAEAKLSKVEREWESGMFALL